MATHTPSSDVVAVTAQKLYANVTAYGGVVKVSNVTGAGNDRNISENATLQVSQVNANDIATDSIRENMISTNAVTTTKIADSAVTTAKIADNAVTAAKLASDVNLTASNTSITPNKLNNITYDTHPTGVVKVVANPNGSGDSEYIFNTGTVSGSELNVNDTRSGDNLADLHLLGRDGTNNNALIEYSSIQTTGVKITSTQIAMLTSSDLTIEANSTQTLSQEVESSFIPDTEEVIGYITDIQNVDSTADAATTLEMMYNVTISVFSKLNTQGHYVVYLTIHNNTADTIILTTENNRTTNGFVPLVNVITANPVSTQVAS